MDAKSLLQKHGMRATPARISVLRYFQQQPLPISIVHLNKEFPDIDKVTLYRMIESFVKNKLVNKHNIGHDHADYELANRDHHHHIYCTECGMIEDVALCNLTDLHQSILKSSSSFASINRHALSFEAICNNCEKK